MLHIQLEDIFKPKLIALWCLLAFKAGMMNATGFLIAGSFVSHITGFGTQIGLAVGHHHFEFGFELLIIPIAFILGAFVASLILDSETEDQIPHYPWVQVIITGTLALIILLFSFGTFDTTPPFINDERSIPLVGLLCFACGLKNGMTTWASHGKIRVTHMTGNATDIGLNLRRLFKSLNWKGRYPEPRRTNLVRIAILTSFSMGSGIAAYLIPILGVKIFHVIFVISVGLTYISLTAREKSKA